MYKRNPIADAFFECVSAFSERTGANTFDSVIRRGGRDGKGDFERMICFAGYEKFDIEYTYSARSTLIPSVVSIFDVRVIFNRRHPEIKYSLYDIMYIMDPENFKCYHFSYIETPERMRRVFESIEADLEVFLTRLDLIASQRPALNDIEEKFKDGVNSFFGYDIFTVEDDGSPDFDLYLSALARYYSVSDSFYESKAYAQFLSGQYKQAYKSMTKYRKKTYYQVRLTQFLSVEPEKHEAVAEGCDTLSEAFSVTKNQNLRIVLGALILFIPCLLLHIGAHFLYAKLIFSGAVWNTAYTLTAAFGSAPFVLPFCVAISYIFSRFTVKLTSKKKRAYLKNLESVAPPFARSGCAKFLIAVLLSFLIVSSLLNVNAYTAFYEDGFRYKTSIADVSGTYYRYEDIKMLVKVKGRYDYYGSYEEYPSYVIVMNSGTAIDLLYEVSAEDAEKHIVPLLREKGVAVTEVHDLSEKGSIY